MVGYLTLSQSQGEVERFFIELVQAGVDEERLQALEERDDLPPWEAKLPIRGRRKKRDE